MAIVLSFSFQSDCRRNLHLYDCTVFCVFPSTEFVSRQCWSLLYPSYLFFFSLAPSCAVGRALVGGVFPAVQRRTKMMVMLMLVIRRFVSDGTAALDRYKVGPFLCQTELSTNDQGINYQLIDIIWCLCNQDFSLVVIKEQRVGLLLVRLFYDSVAYPHGNGLCSRRQNRVRWSVDVVRLFA